MKIEINENTTSEEFKKYILYLQGEITKKDDLIKGFDAKEKIFEKSLEDKDTTINDLKVKNYDLFMQIPQAIVIKDDSKTNDKTKTNYEGKKSITDLTNRMMEVN